MELNRFTDLSLSRRRLLIGAGTTAAAGLAGLAFAPAAAAAQTDFVRCRGSEFTLAGQPWRFGGTNCYYLHQKSPLMIDSVLDDAAALGLRTVRAWAFADGAEQEKPMQPEPGVFDDAAFDSLDHAVFRAGQLGLRLVLALTNNWTDYGGMAQYVRWARPGLTVEQAQEPANHDLFYGDPGIEATFRAWVEHLIGHRNPLTGLRYRDDPTIMTWELANEPRCQTDRSGATLTGWADRTSRLVKRLAPRQLVAVGDEGFYGRPGDPDYPYSDYEGNNWVELTNLPAIDYGTLHLYPDAWKDELSVPERVEWGTAYVRAHLDEPRVAKPVVVEEFGIEDRSVRDATYDAWTRTVEDGGNGSNFWLLTGLQDDGTLYPDYDGFRVVRPSSTANVLAAHAGRMT